MKKYQAMNTKYNKIGNNSSSRGWVAQITTKPYAKQTKFYSHALKKKQIAVDHKIPIFLFIAT